MSLAAVPICCSCSRIAQDVSIACTECNNLCCRACFGLTDEGDPDRDELVRTKRAKVARVCSRCRGADNETEEDILPIKQESVPKVEESTIDEPTTSVEERAATPEGVELTQNRCSLHDQNYTLYCLTCDELVCGSCFPIGTSHMRHQIDHIETVYLERRAKTEQKLKQIEEKVEVLQEHIVLYKRDLQILQEVERSVCGEIDLLCTEAKQSVAKITESRKQMLQLRVDIPANAQKLNDSLQEMARQLPQAEFLKQQLLVDKQCDEMLAISIPRIFIPQHFEDIGCELIPPYNTLSFFMHLSEITAVWPQREIIVSGIGWTVDLRRKDSLFLKLTPRTEEALKFPLKLLVEIPYRPDPVRKTFTVHETSDELEIVSKNELEANGSKKKSCLMVKIGLRPSNALTENGLMKQQIHDTKKRLNESTIRSDKTRSDLESYVQAVAISNQFCVMYFHVKLYKPKNGDTFLCSTNLTDRTNRQWCLQVYQLDQHDTKLNLQAFIVMRKAASTKCQFFIELVHNDPNKNVQRVSDERTFDSVNRSCGWPCFIDRQQLLSDPQFYPNEMLRFRFGVRPIAD